MIVMEKALVQSKKTLEINFVNFRAVIFRSACHCAANHFLVNLVILFLYKYILKMTTNCKSILMNKHTIQFAITGLNHGHIYEQTKSMLDAGAKAVCFFAPEEDLAAQVTLFGLNHEKN